MVLVKNWQSFHHFSLAKIGQANVICDTLELKKMPF